MSSEFDMDVLLEKLDNRDNLSEEEIEYLLRDTESVEETIKEETRWHNEVITIIKIQDRYFAIEWCRCLSETGESEYPNQPYEVEEVEEKRLVWRPKNQ